MIDLALLDQFADSSTKLVDDPKQIREKWSLQITLSGARLMQRIVPMMIICHDAPECGCQIKLSVGPNGFQQSRNTKKKKMERHSQIV